MSVWFGVVEVIFLSSDTTKDAVKLLYGSNLEDKTISADYQIKPQ